MELFEKINHHAADPRRIAVREVGGTPLTYTDLSSRVGACAARLREHVNPGDVVALVSGNHAEFFTACLGVWAAGGVIFPMHPTLAPVEIAAACERSRAKLLITDAHVNTATPRADLLTLTATATTNPPLTPTPRDPDSLALLLQSSGTTGLPKIVQRTRAAVDAVARNVANAAGLLPTDRILGCIPVCHAFGIENAFLGPLWAGSEVILCEGFVPPVVLAQLQSGATVFPGVPFMFEVLATSQPPTPCTLRLAYSAGGMLPAPINTAFAHTFSQRIGQLYGASELGSITFNHPARPAADPLSVGLPMRAVELRIIHPDSNNPGDTLPANQEGHLIARAPSMFRGYADGDAPIIDGFLLTGDLARIADDGSLTITGRIKSLIDVGGTKVNPAEVEAVLRQHPGITDFAVVAIPVTPTVSRLKAVVVPLDAAAFDPEALRRFARERLASFKVPRTVEVRNSLPRSPSGKVLRALLEAPV